MRNTGIQTVYKACAIRSVNPEIAKAPKTRESSLIEDLEHATRKTIIIQSDPTLHWEQYDIY